jgi:hypothetical protein
MYGSARLFKLLLVPTILLGTGAVWAQKPPSRQASEPARDEQEKGSLPDSVRRVERQTGGEVLRAEPMQRDGREVYRLKVLTSDGRVRVMQEDPSEPPAGDRPARQRDRDQDRPRKSKDASEGSDADPPL